MLAAGAYVIVFRILHVMAGIAWAGSAFLFVVFVQPSVAAIAPAGAPFMAEILQRRRLVNVLIGLGWTTVIAGGFLYWHDWHEVGSWSLWIHGRFGWALTIGAVAALIALGFGMFGTAPNVPRLFAVGRRIAESGGPPTPELAAEMAKIQNRLKVFARVSLVLIAIAALAMSTARYL
jgi:hypothetical protein